MSKLAPAAASSTTSPGAPAPDARPPASAPGERRQSVLDVVHALQLHLVARDERALARPSARDEFAAPQEQAFVKLALGAEHTDVRFEARSPRRDDRIVGVQNRNVRSRLVAE